MVDDALTMPGVSLVKQKPKRKPQDKAAKRAQNRNLETVYVGEVRKAVLRARVKKLGYPSLSRYICDLIDAAGDVNPARLMAALVKG